MPEPPHERSDRIRATRDVLGVLSLCTLACAPIAGYFEPSNLIMVYLAGVVFVAIRRGFGAALSTVVGGLLLFDYIYVPPRWGFNPIDPQYFFTFAIALAVGWIVSHLAARARAQAVTADQRARRAQALREHALQLSTARSDAAVAQAWADACDRTLGLAAELRLPGDPRPVPPGWCTVPLRTGDGELATLLHPSPGTDFSPEDQQLLDAFAQQSALALERALYERRSAQSAVQAEGERLRNTLLAGISHDFRTPLTTIVGAVGSLLDQESSLDAARRRLLLQGVLQEARRLHALTSDLLDLNRLQEGEVRLAPEWCPADDLVQEACAALGSRLDPYRLEVGIDPEAVVWCDPSLLGQALMNLLDNAVRHTPAGGRIRIEVQVRPPWWALTVRDSGPGLSPGDEARVFQKFYRSGPAGGTGLGLAICDAVARLHGGHASAANDGGARFELVLPQPLRRDPDDPP